MFKKCILLINLKGNMGESTHDASNFVIGFLLLHFHNKNILHFL